MINKKLAVFLSIVMLFYLSPGAFADGLHFGIIDAIEGKVGEVQEEIWLERTTFTEGTTAADGQASFHDDKHDLDVTVSINNETTNEGVEGVQFQYINTGDHIITYTTGDPDNAYFSAMYIAPVDAAALGSRVEIEPHPVLPLLVSIIVAAVTSTYYVLKLIDDTPDVETIIHNPLVYEISVTATPDQWIDMVAAIPMINIGGVWFAVAHAAAPSLVRKALIAVGVDMNREYKYTQYHFVGISGAASGLLGRVWPQPPAPPLTADITFTITPTVVYIGQPEDVTFTVSESNGIGVDLNYIKGMSYDEQGNLYEVNEYEGQEAQDMIDDIWGTHYLPPNGTLQATLSAGYIATEIPGRVVATGGGTDDNGNFVTDSCEIEIRAGSAARPTALSLPVRPDWILFGAKQK